MTRKFSFTSLIRLKMPQNIQHTRLSGEFHTPSLAEHFFLLLILLEKDSYLPSEAMLMSLLMYAKGRAEDKQGQDG